MTPTALGVDFPILDRADGADGAGDVDELGGIVIARAEAVFEDDAGDAEGVEPLCHRLTFVLGEHVIPPAGANDDGRTVGIGGLIDRDVGDVLRRIADRAGGFAGPESL